MRAVPILAVLIAIGPINALAEQREFTREYTYTASEYDSKVTAREKAIIEIKKLLLEEIGIYIKANTTVTGNTVTNEIINTYTSGVTKLKILNEKWNGKNYYIKAVMSVDIDNLNKIIQNARNGELETPEWAKQYEEFLSTFESNGYLVPKKRSMDIAKKLIMATIINGSTFKGSWFSAYGILGAMTIPTCDNDCAIQSNMSYDALFNCVNIRNSPIFYESLLHCVTSEVWYDYNNNCRSIMYKRYYALYSLSNYIYERFQYNIKGNYDGAPILSNTPEYANKFVDSFKLSYSIYEYMKKNGVHDRTLGDLLGIVNALMRYDDPYFDRNDSILLNFPKGKSIYENIVLELISLKKQRGMPTFTALFAAIAGKKICNHDIFADVPSEAYDYDKSKFDREYYFTLLKLIHDDLNYIESLCINKN